MDETLMNYMGKLGPHPDLARVSADLYEQHKANVACQDAIEAATRELCMAWEVIDASKATNDKYLHTSKLKKLLAGSASIAIRLIDTEAPRYGILGELDTSQAQVEEARARSDSATAVIRLAKQGIVPDTEGEAQWLADEDFGFLDMFIAQATFEAEQDGVEVNPIQPKP